MNIQLNLVSAFLAVGRRYSVDIKIYGGTAPRILQVEADDLADFIAEFDRQILELSDALLDVGCIWIHIPRSEKNYEYLDNHLTAIVRFVRYLNSGSYW